MKRLGRSVSYGVSVLLATGLAVRCGSVVAKEEPVPANKATASPRAFEGILYRTPEKGGAAAGNLAVGVETIAFESTGTKLVIAPASIKEVSTTEFQDDPTSSWVVIKYDAGESIKAAAFRDPEPMRGTKAIEIALLSIWLAGVPAPAARPADDDIASAIEALHATRLEMLYYNNSNVPKNVWNLVFTPGVDDALIRAYEAGDHDDLFRFNLIMILNRRCVGLETEEARRKVQDCMVEAQDKDSFEWVKVEAKDALRRLGTGK